MAGEEKPGRGSAGEQIGRQPWVEPKNRNPEITTSTPPVNGSFLLRIFFQFQKASLSKNLGPAERGEPVGILGPSRLHLLCRLSSLNR